MKSIFPIALLHLLLGLLACGAAFEPCPEIAGTYLSESESEWDATIELQADGTGTVVREVWEAGKPNEAQVTRTELAWGCSGDRVELRYGEVRDLLLFDPELSMDIMGIDRNAPGLIRQEPESKGSMLIGRHFWEKSGWPKEWP